MSHILEIIFLIVAVALMAGVIAIGIYEAVKRRQFRELPEGVNAELKNPTYLVWMMVFCGLNFITSTINHFKDKESLKDKLPAILHIGDSILIKASHGMGFTEIVDILREE